MLERGGPLDGRCPRMASQRARLCMRCGGHALRPPTRPPARLLRLPATFTLQVESTSRLGDFCGVYRAGNLISHTQFEPRRRSAGRLRDAKRRPATQAASNRLQVHACQARRRTRSRCTMPRRCRYSMPLAASRAWREWEGRREGGERGAAGVSSSNTSRQAWPGKQPNQARTAQPPGPPTHHVQATRPGEQGGSLGRGARRLEHIRQRSLAAVLCGSGEWDRNSAGGGSERAIGEGSSAVRQKGRGRAAAGGPRGDGGGRASGPKAWQGRQPPCSRQCSAPAAMPQGRPGKRSAQPGTHL